MRKLVLSGKRIVTGRGSLEYLKELPYKNAVIVTGGSSMIRAGFVDKAEGYLKEAGCKATLISGIRKNPSFDEVFAGVRKLKEIKPDVVIAELSQGMTLLAGSIIITGTPSGVGMGMDPPCFLKPGDVVECWVEKIGSITNPVE